MNTSAKISREIASQRRHFRISAPLRVRLMDENQNDRSYETKDWSLGGFCLNNYTGELPAGESLHASVAVSFSDFYIHFVTSVKPIRFDSERSELACEFVGLDERHRELLKHFSDSLLTGDMKAVDETIRRIDLPVTPVSEKPDHSSGSKPPHRRRAGRTAAMTAAYLACGLVLAVYALNTVYINVFKIRVASASIAASDSVVESPLSGTVDEAYVQVGDTVSRGDPIFYIRDDETLENVELARLTVRNAEANLAEVESKLAAQYGLLESYRKFGNNELQIAQAKTAALKERLRLAQRRHERNQRLNISGVLSDDTLDKVSEELIILQADLQVAVAEETMARSAVEEIERGRFYTDNKLEGEVHELQSAVEAARQKVTLEEARLALVEQRRKRLSVSAPADGTVVSLHASPHHLVEKGQPLLVLEQQGEKAVEALVAARDLDKANLDRPAQIILEGQSSALTATVASVERKVRQSTPMGWDTAEQAPSMVRVKLSFAGSPSDVHDLPSGMPVTVEFPARNLTDRIPVWSALAAIFARNTQKLSLHTAAGDVQE